MSKAEKLAACVEPLTFCVACVHLWRSNMGPCRTPSTGTRDAHFSISLSRSTLLSVTFSEPPVRTLRRGTPSATGYIGIGSLFPTNGSANGSRISRFEFAAHLELFGIRSRHRIQYC